MRMRNGGFSLIELLSSLAILAVIVAIAIPAYRGYSIRTNRSDAKAAVLAMAGALERCYTRFNAYNAPGCTVDITDVPSQNQHYLVSATVTASTFLVSAVPQGPQAADAACGTFRLDHTNERSISGGTATAAQCWDR